jgi:hypothetical protein
MTFTGTVATLAAVDTTAVVTPTTAQLVKPTTSPKITILLIPAPTL